MQTQVYDYIETWFTYIAINMPIKNITDGKLEAFAPILQNILRQLLNLD